MKRTKFTAALALGAAAALTFTACSGGSTDGDSGDSGDSGDLGTISLAFTPGWSDGQSITYLLKNQLEKIGYEIEIEEVADNGPLYAAVAAGDIDIHSSAWPEVTQASYMEEFGDQIESVGVWYDEAKLTIAVPSYSSIDSIEDLADNADMFNGEIIGIEPGAGLTDVTENTMMPEYGLEDSYTLKTSSTASMLTVLGNAIDNEEEVVVTLWRPFWANATYDVKDLEDPKGAMGEGEGLHVNATKGFSEEFPEAAEFIAGMQISDADYGALEELVMDEEYEGNTEAAVEKWLEEYPDAFSTEIS